MKIVLLIVSTFVTLTLAWKSFAPGSGPFDHLSDEEFAAQYLMEMEDEALQTPPAFDMDDFKATFGENGFDWRNHSTLGHCVGNIRDQGHCGSCWAHATTEFLSDRHCIQRNGTSTVNFAPQFMVDCANKTWEAEGCDGAETQTILSWLENYWMVNETCYPYFSGKTETNGTCYMDSCPSGEYLVKYRAKPGSTKLYFNYTNKEIAQDMMENGPLYFSMVVFGDFKGYQGGVYHPVNYTSMGTHAVKCVGWDYENSTASYHWICANSWNTTWGEQGFFKIGFNNFIGYKAGSTAVESRSFLGNFFTS